MVEPDDCARAGAANAKDEGSPGYTGLKRALALAERPAEGYRLGRLG